MKGLPPPDERQRRELIGMLTRMSEPQRSASISSHYHLCSPRLIESVDPTDLAEERRKEKAREGNFHPGQEEKGAE